MRGTQQIPNQHRERCGATGFDQQIVGLLWLFMMVIVSGLDDVFFFSERQCET